MDIFDWMKVFIDICHTVLGIMLPCFVFGKFYDNLKEYKWYSITFVFIMILNTIIAVSKMFNLQMIMTRVL